MTPEEIRELALTMSNKTTLAIQAIDAGMNDEALRLIRQLRETGRMLLEEAEAQR